jgi:hypothetical protein
MYLHVWCDVDVHDAAILPAEMVQASADGRMHWSAGNKNDSLILPLCVPADPCKPDVASLGTVESIVAGEDGHVGRCMRVRACQQRIVQQQLPCGKPYQKNKNKKNKEMNQFSSPPPPTHTHKATKKKECSPHLPP